MTPDGCRPPRRDGRVKAPRRGRRGPPHRSWGVIHTRVVRGRDYPHFAPWTLVGRRLVRVAAGHLALDHALGDEVFLDAPPKLVGLRRVEMDVLLQLQ